MNRYVGAGIRDSGAKLPHSFEAFLAEALASGCDEALVREWQPSTVLETHTHPFDAEAIVMPGEMWLSEGDRTHHLKRGGTFRLAGGELRTVSAMGRKGQLSGWAAGRFLPSGKASIRCSFRAGLLGVSSGNWSRRTSRVTTIFNGEVWIQNSGVDSVYGIQKGSLDTRAIDSRRVESGGGDRDKRGSPH